MLDLAEAVARFGVSGSVTRCTNTVEGRVQRASRPFAKRLHPRWRPAVPPEVPVLDCDNNLWAGVLGGGPEGVTLDDTRKLYPSFSFI